MNMPMSKLSDEYYERKCFLKTDTVPTQSVMKKRMSPALANVYFKSMKPKLKVLAGLAPPMKGGGNDWFVQPEEQLKGKTVLKPINKEHLSKLGFNGIIDFGEKILTDRNRQLEQLQGKTLQAYDDCWKKVIDSKCNKHREVCEKKMALRNKATIERAFHEYCFMYSTSLNNLENLLLNAAIKDIKRVTTETKQYMQTRYETMLKQQATNLYESHDARLAEQRELIKSEFVKKLNETQILFEKQMHDINVEKHLVVEKLRNFLECQNLACQVYVALKEREECEKEIEETKRKHEKEIKLLTEQIALKDFEIKLAKEKEKKRQEFQNIWYKKICEVVKKFQLFVTYSLNELPEHAEFFINTEKLLLLQLGAVLENPETGSIFEFDKTEPFHTPIPRPHPYFLFCDKSTKPNVDQTLCPKHCTSSASQLPVIIVNNRCIYAACDNFKTFTDKVTQYVQGKRGDDEDFIDHHNYANSVPIQCTPSDEIHHLKLETSLQQVLQNEWANVRNLPLECCSCRIPYCFCSRLEATPMPNSEPSTVSSLLSLSSGNKINARSVELEHEREPKWESYMDYVKSKKCKCSKTVKEHLEEHLPPYMRQMSTFEAPDLPHYEMCDLETLKTLVRQAQGKRAPPPAPEPPEPTTRDVETQYSDLNFDFICTCFSDDEVDKFFKDLTAAIKDSKMFGRSAAEAQCRVVTGSISPSYLDHSTQSFANGRKNSLKKLLDDSPELEEIFRKKDC